MAPKKKRPVKAAKNGSGQKNSVSVPQRVYVAAEMMPRLPLIEVVPVAEKLHKVFAGKTATSDELADALGVGRTSSKLPYLFNSAKAYGIVNGEGGKVYSLSETGRKIVAPTYEGEEKEALVKAAMTPTLLSKFYSDYNGHSIPASLHLANLLETRFSIPRDRTGEALGIIRSNGKLAGILDESQSEETPTVRLSGGFAAKIDDSEVPSPGDSSTGAAAVPAPGTGEWDKVCFYITPIGEEGSEVRKHADMMLKHVIEPVMTTFKMTVVRADAIAKSGLITQQVFEHIAKARLCVADLSFSNPNAFYELGVRHVCQLPTIQLIQKGDKIPFDVAQGRTIMIDTSDRYTVMDRIESAKRELNDYVKSALEAKRDAPSDDNPVAVYLPGLKVTLPQ